MSAPAVVLAGVVRRSRRRVLRSRTKETEIAGLVVGERRAKRRQRPILRASPSTTQQPGLAFGAENAGRMLAGCLERGSIDDASRWCPAQHDAIVASVRQFLSDCRGNGAAVSRRQSLTCLAFRSAVEAFPAQGTPRLPLCTSTPGRWAERGRKSICRARMLSPLWGTVEEPATGSGRHRSRLLLRSPKTPTALRYDIRKE